MVTQVGAILEKILRTEVGKEAVAEAEFDRLTRRLVLADEIKNIRAQVEDKLPELQKVAEQADSKTKKVWEAYQAA